MLIFANSVGLDINNYTRQIAGQPTLLVHFKPLPLGWLIPALLPNASLPPVHPLRSPLLIASQHTVKIILKQ